MNVKKLLDSLLDIERQRSDSNFDFLRRIPEAVCSLTFSTRAFIAVLDNYRILHAAGSENIPTQLVNFLSRRTILLLNKISLPPAAYDSDTDVFLLEGALAYSSSIVSSSKRKYSHLIREFISTIADLVSQNFKILMTIRNSAGITGILLIGGKNREAFFEEDLATLGILKMYASLSAASVSGAREMFDIKNRSRKITEFFTAHGTEIQRTIISERTLIYKSRVMQEIIDRLKQAAAVPRPLLITGESGTGKELMARLVHQEKYSTEPFIAVNCSAIPPYLWEDEIFGHVKGAFTDAKSERKGKVGEAGTGVLFFDEVGDMPLDMQSKMLRLMQENQYTMIGGEKVLNANCRFIFATNRNIEDMVIKNEFRLDLFYRISVFTLEIPPLRRRREDIPPLVQHYIDKFANELQSPVRNLDPEVMNALTRYSWPGNVRELENVLIRSIAAAVSETLGMENLPYNIREAIPASDSLTAAGDRLRGDNAKKNSINLEESIKDFTRELIQQALHRAEGNKTLAATYLGIKRGKLLYQLKDLGLE